MIEYLRAPVPKQRDWHNHDYLDRPAGLAWPWPTPEPPALHERIVRLMARFAGAIGSMPPEWREDPAESRP